MIDFQYPRVLPVGENASKRRTLRLFMYVSAEALYSIIRSGALKLSHPWKTNDITECLAQHEKQLRYAIREYGYLCFTADPTSPAMWGYYADRGKGACLVFDFDVIELQSGVWEILLGGAADAVDPLIIRSVCYAETRYAGNCPLDTFFYKSVEWQHEKEYRIVVPLSDEHVSVEEARGSAGVSLAHYYHGILSQLSGVILGPKFDGEDTEVKSYLRACGKQESYDRVYRVPNGTMRISKADSRFALFVEVTRAELNSVGFRFEVTPPLEMDRQSFSAGLKLHSPLSHVKQVTLRSDFLLQEIAEDFFSVNETISFCCFSLSPENEEEENFFLAKHNDCYLLLRKQGKSMTIEFDYPASTLDRLYSLFCATFPDSMRQE